MLYHTKCPFLGKADYKDQIRMQHNYINSQVVGKEEEGCNFFEMWDDVNSDTVSFNKFRGGFHVYSLKLLFTVYWIV